jgi:hypothetical protein
MSTPQPAVPYNPLAKYETGAGARRFTNAKLQSAIDDAFAALPADKSVAAVVHHVYNQDGTAVENVTKVSIVARGPFGSTIMAAAFKDWTKGDIGAEAKLVKAF